MRIHGKFTASTATAPQSAPAEEAPLIGLRERLDNEARAPVHLSDGAEQNPAIQGKPAGWSALPRYENGGNW